MAAWSSLGSLRIAQGQLTVSQINTTDGTVIVKNAPGRTIRVVDAWARAIGGNAGSVTTVDVIVTTTGTKLVTFARAQLTQDAVLRAGAAGTVVTNLLASGTPGKGLSIYKTGSSIDTATAVDYFVAYTVE